MNPRSLFTPLRLGAVELAHRVVMAPLTRLRSRQPGDVPHALNAEYYGQRASQGGLIVTEATDISPSARGYPGAPGIYSREQIEGWKEVTEAVHAKGGIIYCQIWHTGRVSHSSMQPGLGLPGAPSAVPVTGMKHMDVTGAPVDFETPRELEVEEIAAIVADFRQAVVNARAAGFDGVEVHGANGYLIDQFLRDGSNRRTDAYGGSIHNRVRFLLEVIDAVISAWEPGRVGIRLSPWGGFNDMADSETTLLFNHAARALGERDIGYIHLVEPRADQNSDVNAVDPDAPDAAETFRGAFGGPVISAGGYVVDTADAAVAEGRADAIAFGRLFIANPDLPERFRRGAPLNPYDRSTFYGGGASGYVDYPSMSSEPASEYA